MNEEKKKYGLYMRVSTQTPKSEKKYPLNQKTTIVGLKKLKS